MDEYIKKQDLIDWCNEIYKKQTNIKGKEYVNAFLHAVVICPTADVAPKSEVDLYRKQVDELEDELASTYDKLENAKNEVIQAILSLIDDKIRYEVELYNGFNSARPFKSLCQERVNALNDLKLIINYQFRAELKNKYTEVGNNEN